VKTDLYHDQGRLFVTPSIWFNYVATSASVAKMQVNIEGVTVNSSYNLGRYDSVGKWIFVAFTYDGTKSADNAAFYVADENGKVIIDAVETCNVGVVDAVGYGGNLFFGNTGNTGNRAFKGYMDEVRFWSSKTDSSGVLDVNRLEAVRLYDLSLLGCLGGYMAGDINKDCVVDDADLSVFVQDWLRSNPLTLN
jgi:hypothetical protein